MSQEDHTEWPSFDAILREVASREPEPVAPGEPLETEEATTAEDPASDLPDAPPPLELDTSSIRELLSSSGTGQSLDSEDAFDAEDLDDGSDEESDVLDLDNPATGDLLDDDRDDELRYGASEDLPDDEVAPRITHADIAAAPPPPIIPAPSDLETTPETVISDEPLNPFDEDYEGLPDEIVEHADDGWITHSPHDVGLSEAPLEDFESAVSPTLDAPAFNNNPFADLLPTSNASTTINANTAINEDTTGNSDEPAVNPLEVAAADVIESDNIGWTEPTETSTPAQHIGGVNATTFTEPVAWEEPPAPPAHAAEPIDFESYAKPPSPAPERAELAVWDLNNDPELAEHDAQIIPFQRPAEPQHEQPPPPPPASEPTSPVEPDGPRRAPTDLFAPEPAHATPTNRSTEDGANDPWAYMRPKDEPEKISFWANRPKFFGGDERRKARARREARQAGLQQSAQSAQQRCPSCGMSSRVDARDPVTGHVHRSCDSCNYMWIEGVQRR